MIPNIPHDEEWTLETERLLLSPMFVSDAEPLFELLKDPALYSFTGGVPPSNVGALEQRIRVWEHRRSPEGYELWFNWTLRLRANRAVVGYVQATVKTSHADMAWVIGVHFQRKGYACEASRTVAEWLKGTLRMDELRANIHPKHLASQQVAKKLGLHASSEVNAEGEEVWIAAF